MNCQYCKADCVRRGEQREKECRGYVPMTNADRIRAMSDEELQNFLQSREWICETYHLCIDCQMYSVENGCLSVLEWLKQPAEE